MSLENNEKKLNDEGKKLPTLLFIHGSNHGVWCWEKYFVPFFKSKGFKCKSVLLSGHDKNDNVDISFDILANDVLEAIEEVGEKPILIGHSMGGAIAQKVLYKHEEKINGLVLISSVPPKGMLKDFIRLLFTRFKEFSKLNGFNGKKTDEFPINLFFSSNVSKEDKEEYSKLLIPEAPTTSWECLKKVVPLPIKTDKKVLVLGSKLDVMISKKTVEKTAKEYNSKPIIFDDSGHDMMLEEKWMPVANEILNFLNTNF